MPHFGKEGGVRTMTDSRGDSAASDARGADLLLSLAERASHAKTLEATPNGKGFYPLSKQVTPSEIDRNERGPMLMSIHSSGYHRILPSPIKLENHSLVYSTGSESSSPASVEKREADSPPGDGERPLKQARTDDDSETSPQQHGNHRQENEEENKREIEETGSSLISPSSSDEGKKAEVPTPGPPPGSAHPAPYYPHHSSAHPPPHYSYPPHHQYPHGHHPSWGHHHVPPSHMPPYYYPPHPQYYSMVPRSPPPGYPHPHGGIPPPHHAAHAAAQKKPVSAPYKEAGPKDTSMSSKHAEAQAEAIKSISDWQKGVNGGPRTYARCVPLQHPIPSRYWGETNKDVDRKLPDFPRLVNFPDYLSRGQTRTGGEGGASTAEGKRHCVMCGQLRVCSKSANRMGQKSSPAKPDKDADSTVHIIPRQNKGVCTACDVAVWVMVAQDGLEIKWCKGCKNFRPWAAFGEKGLATKCVRCRHRQREKYASQKNEMRRQQESYLEKKEDDILAAQGLSNLMSSQNS